MWKTGVRREARYVVLALALLAACARRDDEPPRQDAPPPAPVEVRGDPLFQAKDPTPPKKLPKHPRPAFVVGPRELPDGTTEVTLDWLSDFDYRPPPASAEPAGGPGRPVDPLASVPQRIRDLAGKRVLLRGFVVPYDRRGDECTKFALAKCRPGCCTGKPTSENQWVEVRMEEGATAPVPRVRPVRVEGVFEIHGPQMSFHHLYTVQGELAEEEEDAPVADPRAPAGFDGRTAGEERDVAGVRLCWCPAGTFVMGNPPDEPERRPGEDQVEVTLSRGFWAGKFEVTQGQWRRVVGEFPGAFTAGEGDDFPVYTINFAEAEGFCRKLTDIAHASGELPPEWEFRLPTEAQWEYACRAGTTTATPFGDKLSSRQANFQGKPYNGAEEGPSLKRAAPVGSYPPNAWGLHDVLGNEFEWCRDWSHAKLPGGVDPDLHDSMETAAPGKTGSKSRVRRGGCWADEGWPCRSAFRLRFEPERRHDHIGFRVVAVRK